MTATTASDGAERVGAERIALRDVQGAIALETDGFRHPRGARSRRLSFTPYEELTHLAVSERMLWLGVGRGVIVLPRRRFVSHEGPEQLLRALTTRIARRPGGAAQLERMGAVEALGRRSFRPWTTRGLALLCALAYVVESLGSPNVFSVGYFSPALVADGDWWRVITATLLHGFPLHLALNLVGLLVLGRLAERALGSLRTLVVTGASALGAMLASGWLLQGSVVGVSGVVFGLAGAVLCIDLLRGAELPAWWRLPPRLLGLVLLAFALDVVVGFVVPFIAGEAHLGGFAAGAVAAGLLAGGGRLGRPAGSLVRLLASAVVAGALLAVAAATAQLVGAEDFAAEHAGRLARLPGISPDELNNHAWYIAIDDEHTPAQLAAALELAERAVAETGGGEAALLDTLAEVQFQLGWQSDAIATIDRAIARDPDEPYYREQRRRFTGEREPEDRPEDPALRPGGRPPLPPDGDGVRV